MIDGEALLDTAVASLVAGIVVTFTSSIAIYGIDTAADLRRDDRELEAVARRRARRRPMLAFAGAVALGLIVMVIG